MNSPLGSPTLRASTAKLRNRLPAQVQRALPLYIACLLFFLVLLNVDIFPSHTSQSRSSSISRRSSRSYSQKYLGNHGNGIAEPFPKKIWQTWKTDPLHFEERDSKTASTWTLRNPGHRYEVLTDNNDLLYVEEHYGPDGLNRPDIVALYRSVNATIIKADLLRYMIMYAEGGVYADIDVEALKPASRFIPERFDAADVDLVIGVEIDEPQFAYHPILGKKSQSFCQWTFMARPGLPVMLNLIEGIGDWLSDVARKQNVPIGEVVLDFDEVIGGTGPSAFTRAVLAEMNRVRSASQPEITWDDFHAMDESKLVGRVLVLTVEAFAAGQGHSDSGNHNARGALVKHHYHASNWPSRHPRFAHPVYGTVEHCNWKAACVRQWDEDVATFKTLSPTEQQRKMDERKRLEEEEIKKAEEEARIAEQLRILGEKQKEMEEQRALEGKLKKLGQKKEDGSNRPAVGFGAVPAVVGGNDDGFGFGDKEIELEKKQPQEQQAVEMSQELKRAAEPEPEPLNEWQLAAAAKAAAKAGAPPSL